MKKPLFIIAGVLFFTGILYIAFFKSDIFIPTEEYVMPQEYLEYSGKDFSFKYPKGFTVVEFDTSGTVRVLDIGTGIYIDLERNNDDKNALNMARSLYLVTTEHEANKSPRKISNNNVKGYYFTRYLENIEFSILKDSAFLDTSKGLYEISMGLLNEDIDSFLYNKGHDAFLMILNTLKTNF